MIKIVIIEDEKRTAQDLVNTLNKIDSDIEIIEILPSIKKAIEFFRSNNNFDLIFSDIKLSDGASFAIFKAVKINKPIIFCTAFDEYMLDAFNTNGIDYILKPFDNSSVAKALDKYQTLKSNFSNINDKTEQLLNKMQQRSPEQKHSSIIINHGDKIIPLDFKKIALFVFEDGYPFVLTFNLQKYLLTNSMNELEGICGKLFFRANRQFLVNKNAIKDVSRYFNRKLLINLNVDYSEQIIVSRLKMSEFIRWLSQN